MEIILPFVHILFAKLTILNCVNYVFGPQSAFKTFFVFKDWLFVITTIAIFLFAFYSYNFVFANIFICICNECRMVVIGLIRIVCFPAQNSAFFSYLQTDLLDIIRESVSITS